jgi:hypothetical protein
MATGSKDYTLARGKLYFDIFSAGTTTKTGEMYFGHAPSLSVASSVEKLDHYNSDLAENAKDKSVVLRTDRTVTFTLDDIAKENLALYLMSSAATVTQTSGTVTDESLTTSALQDRYYQLGASSGNPSGVRGVSAVSVKSGALGAEAARTLGTDYTIDTATGRLYVVPGGAIANAHSLLVTYTRAANTRDQIAAGALTDIEGALRYVADNKTGTNRDYYWPKVSLSSDGELSLKGDEWMTLSFSAEVLKLNDSTAVTYVDGRPA